MAEDRIQETSAFGRTLFVQPFGSDLCALCALHNFHGDRRVRLRDLQDGDELGSPKLSCGPRPTANFSMEGMAMVLLQQDFTCYPTNELPSDITPTGWIAHDPMKNHFSVLKKHKSGKTVNLDSFGPEHCKLLDQEELQSFLKGKELFAICHQPDVAKERYNAAVAGRTLQQMPTKKRLAPMKKKPRKAPAQTVVQDGPSQDPSSSPGLQDSASEKSKVVLSLPGIVPRTPDLLRNTSSPCRSQLVAAKESGGHQEIPEAGESDLEAASRPSKDQVIVPEPLVMLDEAEDSQPREHGAASDLVPSKKAEPEQHTAIAGLRKSHQELFEAEINKRLEEALGALQKNHAEQMQAQLQRLHRENEEAMAKERQLHTERLQALSADHKAHLQQLQDELSRRRAEEERLRQEALTLADLLAAAQKSRGIETGETETCTLRQEETPDQEEAEEAAPADVQKTDEVTTEEGLRGVTVAGAGNMGGLQFGYTSMDEPGGDLTLLVESVKAMNAKSNPREEERKGSPGQIGKMVFSAGINQLAVVAYVPNEKQSVLSCEEWLGTVLSTIPGGKVHKGDKELSFGTIPANAEEGIFTLKIRESLIMEANNFLEKLGLLPKDAGKVPPPLGGLVGRCESYLKSHEMKVQPGGRVGRLEEYLRSRDLDVPL